jgi:TPP-dependent pyruvate/acetoin dehydrogenase alpha subunit
MFLGREFEEMCAQMYYRGKMFGFVHLYSGQEAVSTGVIRHLRQDDYICSTYRDHVHALSKNVPPRYCCFHIWNDMHSLHACCSAAAASVSLKSACLHCLQGDHGGAVRQEDGHLQGPGRLHAHVLAEAQPGAADFTLLKAACMSPFRL